MELANPGPVNMIIPTISDSAMPANGRVINKFAKFYWRLKNQSKPCAITSAHHIIISRKPVLYAAFCTQVKPSLKTQHFTARQTTIFVKVAKKSRCRSKENIAKLLCGSQNLLQKFWGRFMRTEKNVTLHSTHCLSVCKENYVVSDRNKHRLGYVHINMPSIHSTTGCSAALLQKKTRFMRLR